MDKVVSVLREVMPSVQPTARDGHEAVALAVHAACVAQKLAVDGAAASAVLPSGWSGDGSDVISVIYTGAGDKKLTLKLLKMGPVLLVHGGLGDDPDNVETLELTVDKYINPDAPLDNGDRAFTLGLSDLVTQVDKFLANVGAIPTRGGGASADAASSQQQQQRQQREPRYEDDPYTAHDPLMIGRPQRPGHYNPHAPFHPAGDLGRGDLDPFHQGGGMLLDPRGLPGAFGGGPGPRPLGPGQLPRARFDPIFPGGPDGPVGPRGPRGPDPDHMPMPPDSDDYNFYS
eukprot:m.151181 g.151181  ORF g.151181 m.151181 type:complete len:287 (-) comp11695_c3_seq1:383-1243(-)